ncbi:MAG TPA: bifunctional DNA-formamidopyrimidine glycosylase/DNA-(apurinic or apyrimidinic site) lyase [candidate division Zixibacteria bacterium]
MPELPEVETIVRGLRKTILGKRIKEVKFLCPGIVKQSSVSFICQTVGQKVKDIKRRGKNIVICLSQDNAILVHLGMSGHLLYLCPDRKVDKHDHIIFRFLGDVKELRYNDPRKFGKMRFVDLKTCPDLDKLGPEPMEISEKEFVDLMRKRKGRVKSVLLNQKVLAGIGNIYADEVLFEAGINPLKKIDQINTVKLRGLRKSIGKILAKAMRTGGSSIRTYTDLSRKMGRFQLSHKVYGREGKPCKRCGVKIKRIVINQRSSYFCPRCQKP